ncbi:Topoisomerase II OS=Stutzerimonas stutzeri OX=316 GN=CXK95_16110 PE=4 SV=1 [Stutzerimonas stutzeri]
MSDSLRLVLEDVDGTQLETSCTRFAVIWQGREVWNQQVGNKQLMIGVDVEEGDTEYANLLLRPLATNLVSLELEMEPIEEGDEGHVHGPDCNHSSRMPACAA